MPKSRLSFRKFKDSQSAAPIDTMNDSAFVDWCYRKILRRESDDSGKKSYMNSFRHGLSRLALIEEFFNSKEYTNRFAGCSLFSPGHPLSPLPSGDDIEAHGFFDWSPPHLPAIDLREEDQMKLLQQLARHYPRLPFTPQPVSGQRYGYENTSYSFADAILLGCMMMEFQPQRIIEVGSGHSSAAMLDVKDRFYHGRMDCLFIDPDPGRLRSLLGEKDTRVEILEKKLQEIPLNTFDHLTAGDILFIDSSHVSKVNSDVNRIFFEILPRLQKNVLIHIHDVFYPFEYPQDWLRRGWVWNEQYLLHAFLQYNSAFTIRLFSSFMIDRHRDWFFQHMPDCLRNTGGSLWMEKTE